ncbi:LOW QUALITY PROTEIN: hypothetical protein OSB04_031390 [Centaurea solstitialis]|uniref:Uncharacterized protein n=1 Tax=Centaurea solstitialis TaxID=347529 RepID=A0AA38VU95_9ASTR|nr:LOW QUALITY PROTEIN: hypothetical protein OSB04_031390 [Centaurea solstitialis]
MYEPDQDVSDLYLSKSIHVRVYMMESWKPVIEKIKSKLASWKAKVISLGGRLTLVKSVLRSSPLYYFVLVSSPVWSERELKGIRNRFFWGVGEKKKREVSHGWAKTIDSLEMGGLNIGSLKIMNKALLAKWRWRFLSEKETLWIKVIGSIYGDFGGLRGRGSRHGGGPLRGRRSLKWGRSWMRKE